MGEIQSKLEKPVVEFENSSQPKQESKIPEEPLDLTNRHISASDFIKIKNSTIKEEYQLKELVGRGAYSVVRRAVHIETGVIRAVKILDKGILRKENEQKFLSEVEILSSLDHPNIMKIHEMFEDSANYYIISEYLAGGELHDRLLKKKIFSEKEAAKLMRQLLAAILYCHKNNIAHRDIKLENLMYESKKEDSNLKLIDFGGAKYFENQLKIKGVFGTPDYAAPEILSGEYTEKCDIWSAGVVLYALLSGKLPFSGADDAETILKVKAGIYSLDDASGSTISTAAKNLIKKMLEVNPSGRYSAEQALRDPWFQLNDEKKELSQTTALETLQNLQKFKLDSKLQEISWVFLVSNFATNENKEKIIEIFETIDSDRDGKLSRKDLKQGFTKFMQLSPENAEKEVEKILEVFGGKRDGDIKFTEFLIATISREHLLKKENVEAVFKMFDRNKDGKISSDEFRLLFPEKHTQNISKKIWDEWVAQVRKNSDGGIDFENFNNMMIPLMSR